MNTSDASVPATNFKADVISVSAMANGYFDFAASGVSPYIGAGIGFAMNRIGPVDFDDGAGFTGTLENGGTATGAAWSLMAGVGIPLSGRTVMDIDYRYSNLGKLKIDASQGYDGASGKLNAHELTLGFRF
jgi:opacity protein-like surface antigen